MSWYPVLVSLHVVAALVWFGHMFFWSLVAGLALKEVDPPENGRKIRDFGLRWGGFGWPSLFVLGITGVLMVILNNITLHHVISGGFIHEPIGRVMAVKIFLVGCMAAYQWFVGHRPAPRLIYLNMLAAVAVISLSILRVRPPW
ncbi:MAG: hypothetical protein ABIH26_01435 [Candidatus Eisenbacteria bacterium]